MRFSQISSIILILIIAVITMGSGGCEEQLSSPKFISVLPAPVGNTLKPYLRGEATEGTKIRIYGTKDCTGPILNADLAEKFNSEQGIQITVQPRAETYFSAVVFDDASLESTCAKAPFTYLHDPDAPAAPVLLGTTPGSPSTETSPVVRGMAEPEVLVDLYLSEDCSGEIIGSIEADEATGEFEIQITVPKNTASRISARATDVAGNTSACVEPENVLSFVNDSTTTVQIVTTNPLSPSTDTQPVVIGFTEPGAQVTIYDNALCISAVGQGYSDSNGVFSVSVDVSPNQTSILRAVARDLLGNTSDCPSDGFAYTHDSIPPDAPWLTGTIPLSPANQNNPSIIGSAEPGSTVTLYARPTGSGTDCSGTAVGTTTAAGDGTFAISVVVADNTSTQFSAKATDLVGNTSLCSVHTTVYVEDSQAQPLLFTATSPTSPGQSQTPRIIGQAEAGATVELFVVPYTSMPCEDGVRFVGTAQEFNTLGIQISVPANEQSYIRGRITDAANNVSACSTTYAIYQHDDIAPPAPTYDNPSPVRTRSSTYTIEGHASGSAAKVLVYPNTSCTGSTYTLVDVHYGFDFGAWSYEANLPSDGTYRFSTKARDGAGNLSPCGTSFTVVRDSTAPSAPAMVSVNPPSPGVDTTPTLRVLTVPSTSADTHKVYLQRSTSSSVCVGTSDFGSITVPVSSNASVSVYITVSIPQPSGTTYYYRAVTVDQAGNRSACSTNSISYRTL